MAAIAGMSRFSTPIKVWQEKVADDGGTDRPSAMMALGTVFEPAIASLFQTASGMRLVRRNAPVRDRRRPWLGGHIDRWAYENPFAPPEQYDAGPWPAGVFEAKWQHDKEGYGPTGSAEIPAGYAVQVQHYLGVTGREWGYVGALLGYADFRWYVLHRDEDSIRVLREMGERFWVDNVLAGVPPEPDGSDDYTTWLKGRYPTGAGEAVASVEQQIWAAEHTELDVEIAALERRRAKLDQHLQDSMAGLARLLLPDGKKIHWSSYPQTDTDWRRVADDMAAYAPLLVAKLEQRHTTIAQRRPWRFPKPDKETPE